MKQYLCSFLVECGFELMDGRTYPRAIQLYSYVTILCCMNNYATISVPADIKKCLEKAKGNKEWGDFLLELYTERKLLKSKKAFEEAASLLTDEDLKSIAESSEVFREKFAFA